jgi:D-alanyl-D-alanine endopeptidase (penicillin-binding protein 7)
MKVLVCAVTIVVFAVVIPLAILSPRHADEAMSSAPPAAPVAPPAEPEKDFLSAAELLRHARPEELSLRSSAALVLDEREHVVLYERNADEQRPIASLTKLMTAMVCLDAKLPLDEVIVISRADRDRLRGSKSRLSYGTKLTRRDTLQIALAASENRAAHALARTYPGGKEAFMKAMNDKAARLGLKDTRFRDPTGLHSGNVSTAADLARLVAAAGEYGLIRRMTTKSKGSVTDLRKGWKVEFLNTNRLVRKKEWSIGLSKTGYIADAGNCLVMQTEIEDRPVIIVLLNSWGKLSKFGDSNRIRKWLAKAQTRLLSQDNSETPGKTS